jgi:hypothetical protein
MFGGLGSVFSGQSSTGSLSLCGHDSFRISTVRVFLFLIEKERDLMTMFMFTSHCIGSFIISTSRVIDFNVLPIR